MEETIREELVFPKYKGECTDKIEQDFFQRIKETGGWPLEYEFVCVYDAEIDSNRVSKFTNKQYFVDHWFTVSDRDHYLYWLISDNFKKDKRLEITSEIKYHLDEVMRKAIWDRDSLNKA